MARESALWRWLKRAEAELADDLHMHRVENAVSLGMPDVEGHMRSGRQFWIELKSSPRPARHATPVRVKFQPRQVPWLRRRWDLGGLAWVLLQVGSGAERRVYLVPGGDAWLLERGLVERSIEELSAVPVKAGPAEVIRRAAILAP